MLNEVTNDGTAFERENAAVLRLNDRMKKKRYLDRSSLLPVHHYES
jgi:hypothetical protein